MFIKRFFISLYKSFINIYDDSEFYESGAAGLMRESKSFGQDYIDKLAGANPLTGKRKISVRKIIFRILIVALAAFFIFMLIRVNTSDSLWMNRR
jgi:hypothetical protein